MYSPVLNVDFAEATLLYFVYHTLKKLRIISVASQNLLNGLGLTSTLDGGGFGSGLFGNTAGLGGLGSGLYLEIPLV
jgi:hypothetical protein